MGIFNKSKKQNNDEFLKIDVKPLIEWNEPNGEGCIVSDMITKNGWKAGCLRSNRQIYGGIYVMYERMLNKQVTPTIEEMTKFCGENSERFTLLNEWLTSAFNTEKKVVFPYGNNYGWGVAHKKKNKLICNIFAEDNAFTVMMRLSDKQYNTVYDELQKYTQEYIDSKYPCGDGGWIHYRVTCKEHFDDIKILLSVKCS